MNKILLSTFLSALSLTSYAAQMDYNFNSPVFNGSGYGTYVLSVKQLQDTAAANNKSQQEALRQAAETAAMQGSGANG